MVAAQDVDDHDANGAAHDADEADDDVDMDEAEARANERLGMTYEADDEDAGVCQHTYTACF